MDINETFPSNYLRAADLKNSTVKVTMSHVSMEDIGDDHKPVLYFSGKTKGLVLNKTNANTIAGMHSPETDNWAGKMIAIFPTQVDFQGRQVAAIRVKMSKLNETEPEFVPEPNEPPKDVADGDEIPF